MWWKYPEMILIHRHLFSLWHKLLNFIQNLCIPNIQLSTSLDTEYSLWNVQITVHFKELIFCLKTFSNFYAIHLQTEWILLTPKMRTSKGSWKIHCILANVSVMHKNQLTNLLASGNFFSLEAIYNALNSYS